MHPRPVDNPLAHVFRGWRSIHHLTGDEFKARLEQLKAQGFRLTDLSGCWDGRSELFTDVWEESDDRGWRVHWGLPLGQYQSVFLEMKAEGFRPIRLSFYATPFGVKVCALWIAASPGPEWEAHHGLSRGEYQDTFLRLKDAGYRPVDITGYEDSGQERYAAVWEYRPRSPAWEARHHLTHTEYQAEFLALGTLGYVLDKVVGYTVAGQVLYAAIWTKRAVPAAFSDHRIDPGDYQRFFDDRFFQGCRVTQLAACAVPDGIRYAAVWVSEWFDWGQLNDVDTLIDTYMTTYNVPGLSLAISQHGRLVFARARGWADKDASTPLSVRHRMRVASVSKPITAAAVLLLVQQGPLALADTVLGTGARLGTTFGTKSYGANEKSITIDHLLTHTSGFQNKPSDPMLDQPALSQSDLIGWTLDNRNPVTTPGTKYFYLNFGYCLLGRIIEAATGQTYENYVTTALLNPAGVTSMQIAGDTKAARASDEVVYYGQSGEDPYGMKVARMDAHGGWIATPIDLLRLLRLVDGRGGADLLTSSTITSMTSVPAGVTDSGTGAASSYARGWVVNSADDWNHNGALPGTLALLRRRPDGIGHAAAINTRRPDPNQNAMMNAFYQLLDDVQAKLGVLPWFDLF